MKPSFRAILGYYVPHLTLNYIFTNTDLNKSIANILTDNERVVSLYKEIGYREVGVLKNHIKKNGKYHNMILLEYLKSDWLSKRDTFNKFKANFYKGT